MRILNHEGLDESCGGDKEFALELFTDLSQRARALRAGLGEAVLAHSSDGIRKAAHELKGSSLTLGAEALAEVCKRLELLGHEDRLAEVPALVVQLDTELERLWAYLQDQGIYPAST